MNIKDHIRSVPDFPKPGIVYYDISPLLAPADAWSIAMGDESSYCEVKGPSDYEVTSHDRIIITASRPGVQLWVLVLRRDE